MIDILSQLLSAFVGALGFALVFGMRRRYLFAASLGALLGWGVYMLVDALMGDVFLPSLAAAAFALTYSEMMAKAVPGGSLYYTMSYAVHRDIENARLYGVRTAESALAIAAGISIVLAIRELRTKRQ